MAAEIGEEEGEHSRLGWGIFVNVHVPNCLCYAAERHPMLWHWDHAGITEICFTVLDQPVKVLTRPAQIIYSWIHHYQMLIWRITRDYYIYPRTPGNTGR